MTAKQGRGQVVSFEISSSIVLNKMDNSRVRTTRVKYLHGRSFFSVFAALRLA